MTLQNVLTTLAVLTLLGPVTVLDAQPEVLIPAPDSVILPDSPTLDPSHLPDGEITMPWLEEVEIDLEPLHGLGSGLESELAVLDERWRREGEELLLRIEETPYSLEDLQQAITCSPEEAGCDLPVVGLLHEQAESLDPHGCATPTLLLAGDLADRIGHLGEFQDFLGQLDPLPPPLQQTAPVPANCGPKTFRSPGGRFDIRYSDCDTRLDPMTDTGRTFIDLLGTSNALTAGGRIYTRSNAPDSVELTALLLDSALTLLSVDFTGMRPFPRRFSVELADIPLGGLTGARGYVDPFTGDAMIRPDQLPPTSTTDLRQLHHSVVVHELLHMIQFDYGWNFGRLMTDDNFMLQNLFGGRNLLESTAEAITLHLHQTHPFYFPSRRETNYYDFWSNNVLTGSRDPLGYGWAMQMLSNDPPGTTCIGCEIAHQMFLFFTRTSWSREAFFRFVASRDPRLTKMEIPRQFFLRELLDNFLNVPPDLVRSRNYRMARTLRKDVNASDFSPNDNLCRMPNGSSYAIRQQDGSSVRCEFRPFPMEFSGVPQMLVLPIQDLPESLEVRVGITYMDTRTGQPATKMGGRTLRSSVRVIEASGSQGDWALRQFRKNRILRSHSRVWGAGNHLLTIDNVEIDRANRGPAFHSQMKSLAFLFEWHPTPPLNFYKPFWDIRVTSRRRDADRDGVFDFDDLCVLDADPSNANLDGDRFGDVCDDDLDGDRIPNDSDLCPRAVGKCDADRDGDNVANSEDNCPDVANWDQRNSDGDDRGDACDSDSKPDLIITQGSIPPAGAGFVVKNVGTGTARGPLRYLVQGYINSPAGRLFIRRTLDFELPAGGLRPGQRTSTEIPEEILDPAQRSRYQNVEVMIDSNEEIDELDETNNRLTIR